MDLNTAIKEIVRDYLANESLSDLVYGTCKHSSNFLQSRVKFFGKCSTEPGFLPKTVCQENRRAERIHFIFAFPDTAVLQGVVFGTVPIGGRIESICVRVDTDQFGLLLNHTFQYAAQAAGLFGIGNIVGYLCGGISKPHATALRTDLYIDWQEAGKETVPLLQYRVPTAYQTDEFLYDIPGGAIRRQAGTTDVPALQYGVAVHPSGDSVIVVSDSKYGYRGLKKSLGLSLINSSTGPDPYPELGIQKITLWTGSFKVDEKAAKDFSERCNHVFTGDHSRGYGLGTMFYPLLQPLGF